MRSTSGSGARGAGHPVQRRQRVHRAHRGARRSRPLVRRPPRPATPRAPRRRPPRRSPRWPPRPPSPAARWVATSGPVSSARPASSKARTASGSPSPTPPSASGSRSAKKPASPSSRHSARSSAGASSTAARRPLAPEARGQQLTHARPQRPLIIGELESPRSASPSLREAQDPLGHDVPLDLRGAGRDGVRQGRQPVERPLGCRGRAPRDRAPRRRRRTAPAARASTAA